MPNQWAPIDPIRRIDSERMEARVVFGKDASWFSGHFPEHPVLPGVAMLASVVQLAMEGIGLARKDIAGFRKVRFNKLIGPGDELTISMNTASMGKKDEVFFRIQCGDQKAVQGVLLVK